MAFILRNTSNQVSREVRANIQLGLPELEDSQQRQIFREAIRHTCYAMTELAAVWCWPPQRILDRVTSFDICPEFEQSQGSKIILAPHLGSWETLAIWLGHTCDPMFLYKRRKNKAIDQFVKQARARTGGTPVPTKKHGLRQLLVGLKEGRDLMILPDQKPSANKARIDSQFFGVNAPTTTLVQNLCNKVHSDVFIAAVLRSSPVGEFRLIIRPLEHQRLALEETVSAQYMNDQIELLARQFIEQYQWGYRRFSNQAYTPVTRESS